MSIATISRLHHEARQRGIVKINVDLGIDENAHLGEQLKEYLGAEILVVPGDNTDLVRDSKTTGALAFRHIEKYIKEGMTIGWASGNTMFGLVNSINKLTHLRVNSVPLIGGWDILHPHLDSNLLASKAAEVLGGRSYNLMVPAKHDSIEQVEQAMQNPQVQATVEKWDNVDLALFSSGLPPEVDVYNYTVIRNVSEEIRQSAVDSGVVGDIMGHNFTIDGEIIDLDWTRLLVTIPMDKLLKIPNLIAVIAGAKKIPSLIGMARTGVTSLIITNAGVARGALKILAAEQRLTSSF
ncbi:MAG: hypothetical protein KF916_02560 [Microbacteriaceae bacterium]|nr:hypothetical protein [Microbacteriaceae bacterium]